MATPQELLQQALDALDTADVATEEARTRINEALALLGEPEPPIEPPIEPPVIPPEPKPPEPEPPTDAGPELPEALRTFKIDSREQFLKIYGDAKGGDLILVKDGTNLGGLTLSRSGDSYQRPIMIKADRPTPAPLASAQFGGGVTMSGRFNTVWGIRAMGQCVSITGMGNRLRRVLFRGARIRSGAVHPRQCYINGSGILVEYCEMDDCDARGFAFDSNSRRCKLLHCYVHDFTVKAGDQVYEPIQVGESAGDFRRFTDPKDGVEIGWCFVDNCNRENNENECPSIKFPFTYLHHYHINNSKNVQLRIARNARIEMVRMTGNSFTGIQGPDHTFNSVWVDASAGFRVFTGNWDSDNPGNPPSGAGSAPPQYPHVKNLRLIGCKGNVEVGYVPDLQGTKPIKPENVRIEAHLAGTIKGDCTQSKVPSDPILGTPPIYGPKSQGLWADL